MRWDCFDFQRVSRTAVRFVGFGVFGQQSVVEEDIGSSYFEMTTMWPNKTPEPTAESAFSFAPEVRVRHAAVRLWLSLFR
jgi:hypothetical protein